MISLISLEPLASTLPVPLSTLYILQGLTLSLPSLAYTSYLNDIIALPPQYLPLYYTLAFLPYNFKPVYASLLFIWEGSIERRILSRLYALSSLSFISTAFVASRDYVLGSFLLAFVRGVLDSWSEFILDCLLIRGVQNYSTIFDGTENTIEENSEERTERGITLASWQSWAASCRNLGTMIGGVIIVITSLLEIRTIRGTFLLTSVIPLIGLVVTRMGICRTFDEYDTLANSHRKEKEHSPTDLPQMMLTIVPFQCLLLLLGLREFFTSFDVSATLWWILFILSLFTVAATWAFHNSKISIGCMWPIALFLISRHSIPSSSIILSNFTYNLLQSIPTLYPSITLLQSFLLTLASWTYRQYIANSCTSQGITCVIISLTVLSSICTMMYIPLLPTTNISHVDTATVAFWTFLRMIDVFVSEWYFLPSIIIASVGTRYIKSNKLQCHTFSDTISYGILTSCIEFGNQIGGWISFVILELLHVSREEPTDSYEQKSLQSYIFICSIIKLSTIASVLFLRCYHNRTINQ